MVQFKIDTLQKLQGDCDVEAPVLTARAAFTREKPGSRQEYLRVKITNSASGLIASAFDNQSSGVLSSLSRSNALAVIPVATTVAEGDAVEIILLEHLIA